MKSLGIKKKNDVKVTMCVIWNGPYPLGDVILCNCRHLYHLWCVTICFNTTNSCEVENCASVHLEWLKSFGFPSPIVELEEKAIDMDCEIAWRMAITQRKVVW